MIIINLFVLFNLWLNILIIVIFLFNFVDNMYLIIYLCDFVDDDWFELFFIVLWWFGFCGIIEDDYVCIVWGNVEFFFY